MGAWLRSRLPEQVDVGAMLRDRRFVYDDLRAVRAEDRYRSHTFVWFHRDLREEPEVPGSIRVVHRDERIVVVDKPPFLSTIPRGRHVRQSVVVRLREELGLPELAPAHRLDRITSGLLVLTAERRWRGPYQTLFQDRAVAKVYRAVAPLDPALALPLTVRNRIVKERGVWQAGVVPGEPNAETFVELERRLEESAGRAPRGVYRLSPSTGRTHQLRVHLNGLGIPIENDPLYPAVREVDVDDFSAPLQLLAASLAFTDPVDGTPRRFESARALPLGAEEPARSR